MINLSIFLNGFVAEQDKKKGWNFDEGAREKQLLLQMPLFT